MFSPVFLPATTSLEMDQTSQHLTRASMMSYLAHLETFNAEQLFFMFAVYNPCYLLHPCSVIDYLSLVSAFLSLIKYYSHVSFDIKVTSSLAKKTQNTDTELLKTSYYY